MASLRDIRKRIKSVKNTQKITKAMKMVAAAKLKRAQEKAEAARPYSEKMGDVIADLMQHAAASANLTHPLLAAGADNGAVEALALTSDRGLCGGFNSNVVRKVLKLKIENDADGLETHVYTAGKKGYEGLRKNCDHKKDFGQIFDQLNFEVVAEIAQEVCERFAAGEVNKFSIMYNEFKGELVDKQILPIVASASGDSQSAGHEYEPNAEAIFSDLLPKYVATQIYQALLETSAAEHLARMMAMDAATNNAKDVVSKLTLQYNRARQAAITTELMEIIGGAEALK
jgi:F-type H+-transporting ATPase subunit gamma